MEDYNHPTGTKSETLPPPASGRRGLVAGFFDLLLDLGAERGVFLELVEDFVEAAETTAAVLGLELPLGTRVCLTVLKKLYERRGSGRKESALHRGLDHHGRRLVPDVLRALQSEGLASPYKAKGTTIWLPDRSSRQRVGRMIAAPTASTDPVLQRCSGFGS